MVSSAPLVVYDPTRANVLAHEQVNEWVMREFTVLPMSFGTLFRTEEDLVALLRSTCDTLRDVLAKMEGKVEFGLKASWDRAQVLREIEQEDPEIGRLRSRGAGAAYLSQIEIGRQVEALLARRAGAFIQDIHALLHDAVVASHAGETIGESMIMNAAFLIERNCEAEFLQRVEQIDAKYGGRLAFQVSGPWPPYNFVHIRLQLQPGREG